MDPKLLDQFIIFKNEHLTKKIIYEDEHLLSFTLNINVGHTVPAHSHDGSSLSIYVVEGMGDIIINKQTYKSEPGQIFYLFKNDSFAVSNVIKPLSLFVHIAPNPDNPIYRQGR